jgi:hypothetical protein
MQGQMFRSNVHMLVFADKPVYRGSIKYCLYLIQIMPYYLNLARGLCSVDLDRAMINVENRVRR